MLGFKNGDFAWEVIKQWEVGDVISTTIIVCYVSHDFGSSATDLLRVVTQSITNALPVPMLRQVYAGVQKRRFRVGGPQKMGSW